MHTEHLKVTGMTCGGCISTVTRALQAVSGVGDVTVSLAGGEATVQYDERKASVGQLTSAVTRAGYGVDAIHGDYSPPSKKGCCG